MKNGDTLMSGGSTLSLALSGFAEGTARHLFITARMERVQEAGEALIETLGHTEAIPLIVDAMEEAQKTAEHLKEAIDCDEVTPSIAVDEGADRLEVSRANPGWER